MKALGIDNVLIPVGDLDTAVEFYSARLGLPVQFTVPDHGLAVFRVGDETPGLMVRVDPSAGAGRSPAMRVWLEVLDARTATLELTAQGVTPTAPPFQVATGWTVEFADPWGNIIGLTDYTSRPELGR